MEAGQILGIGHLLKIKEIKVKSELKSDSEISLLSNVRNVEFSIYSPGSFNEYFDSLGMDSAIYAWFPGAGSPLENTYDYLEVWANSSMKEWGIVPDAWLSGNPDPSGLSDLRECDTPRVYYSQYVGGKTAE